MSRGAAAAAAGPVDRSEGAGEGRPGGPAHVYSRSIKSCQNSDQNKDVKTHSLPFSVLLITK